MSLPAPLRQLGLQPGGSAGPDLVRWCQRLGKHAESCGRRRDPNSAVHQLRLVAKALRAAVRLADSGVPAPDLVHHDKSIRKLASALGSMRDAAVQGELLLKLVREEDRRLHDAGSTLAEAWLLSPPDSAQLRETAAGLCQIASVLGAELRHRVDASGIRKALRRSLRKTLARRGEAEARGSTEAFHAWRRWQKRLESQLLLVAPTLSRRLERQLDRIHRLQEELGALHDVDQLADRLRSPSVRKHLSLQFRRRLQQLIQRKQAQLKKRVLRSARKALDLELSDHVLTVVGLWAKGKVSNQKLPSDTGGSPSRSSRGPPRT